jgi:hypothetical protein
VEWGLEESSHEEALSYFRDNVVAALALDYDEMKMADIAVNFGALTKTAVLNATRCVCVCV